MLPILSDTQVDRKERGLATSLCSQSEWAKRRSKKYILKSRVDRELGKGSLNTSNLPFHQSSALRKRQTGFGSSTSLLLLLFLVSSCISSVSLFLPHFTGPSILHCYIPSSIPSAFSTIHSGYRSSSSHPPSVYTPSTPLKPLYIPQKEVVISVGVIKLLSLSKF